ncbi:hypothetical protein AB0P15_08815 [Streptomyces sp. NPDC087917]|uniref:hypothetical protein n=1 Tax=unclassified Streptomyces TaxID=2593676 RepID=UPI003428DE80
MLARFGWLCGCCDRSVTQEVPRLTQVVAPDGTTWRYAYDPPSRRMSKQGLSTDGAVAEEVLFTGDGTCEQGRGAGGRADLAEGHRLVR